MAWTNSQPNSYSICHLLLLNYWHTCPINPFLLVNISPFLELQRLRQYTNTVANAQMISNYRPISMLGAFSKILEKLVHKRILSFLNQNNILSKLQFGFRPTFSTHLACSYLSSKISNFFNENSLVLAIFLDVTKAFDTLDHDIMLTKLRNYGFHGVVNDWFRNYLHNRQQKVRINDKY